MLVTREGVLKHFAEAGADGAHLGFHPLGQLILGELKPLENQLPGKMFLEWS